MIATKPAFDNPFADRTMNYSTATSDSLPRALALAPGDIRMTPVCSQHLLSAGDFYEAADARFARLWARK
jgi:hypothetical protein